jgi:proteasome lid subunit RPN8/RPN11
MEPVLRISSELLEQMLTQARAGAPLETCGVLGGQGDRALAAYPIANALHSPVRYRADPEGLLSAYLDIEARGWDIVGIYHSHPAGPDMPSATDIAEAYYPEAAYVIISLAHEPPLVRGFHIVDGRVSEVHLV